MPDLDDNALGNVSANPASSKNLTVDQLLADKIMLDVNAACARRISANIEILKEATGVTDDDEIHRLPIIFSNDVDNTTLVEPLRARAYHPAMINGLVLSRTDYVSPKPWGPWINGKDVFEEASNAVYAKVGLTVTYMDDCSVYTPR
ncbi:hypothetical protein diail_4248 [Diaporthe ilicicola]|nr:hypothetical protein diail_4248 [Diaporthe ilicicola]